jgi:hypothetical protein
MLCGGVSIIGMYSLSSKAEKEAIASLRKLAVAACRAADTVPSDATVYALYVNAKSSKMSCKTVSLDSSSADLKPVDIKAQECCSSLKEFRCAINIDILVPVAEGRMGTADQASKLLAKRIKNVQQRLEQVIANVQGGAGIVGGEGKGYSNVEFLLPCLGSSGAAVAASGKADTVTCLKGNATRSVSSALHLSTVTIAGLSFPPPSSLPLSRSLSHKHALSHSHCRLCAVLRIRKHGGDRRAGRRNRGLEG